MDSVSETGDTTTTIIPYDNRGRDPKSLVGRKIQRKYMSGKGISLLTFKFRNGTVQFVSESDLARYEDYITENDNPSWFHFDPNLKVALNALQRDGGIVEDACVAERKVGSESFRVIGLKLSGMTKMGFIYCKKEERTVAKFWLEPGDSDDYEWESATYED